MCLGCTCRAMGKDGAWAGARGKDQSMHGGLEWDWEAGSQIMQDISRHALGLHDGWDLPGHLIPECHKLSTVQLANCNFLLCSAYAYVTYTCLFPWAADYNEQAARRLEGILNTPCKPFLA